MDDPFVLDYEESELQIAAEFLTNWLPFLTRSLCPACSETLTSRIRSLPAAAHLPPHSPGEEQPSVPPLPADDPGGGISSEAPSPPLPPPPPPPPPAKVKMSWADMAQEDDELEAEAEADAGGETEEVKRQETEEKGKDRGGGLTRERREHIRFMNVGRKKDFICLERVKGKIVNVLEGLELHTGVFSAAEQSRIVNLVYELQMKGRNGELADHTYSEPEKWMRGKGRVTIQFGCCYNYAFDNEKNPPGILRHVIADPLPPLFKLMIKRLVRWHVLPTTCIPDSCIVNIYEPGDCIPPYIDSHDFVRPFCTASFLGECNILFGSKLKIAGAGEFSGASAIPLPAGSVLVLNGNGADVAKHCVPAVPSKRISITFRKMDNSLHPYGFKPEANLHLITPLPYESEGGGSNGFTYGGNRKHNTDGRALGRAKDPFDDRQPLSVAEQDFHGTGTQRNAIRQTAKRTLQKNSIRQTKKTFSHQGIYRRHHDEDPDAFESQGSSRQVSRHIPVADSPGIHPPRQSQDDINNQRRQDIYINTEIQSEDAPHRSFPETFKHHNKSIMRIICTDNQRIVVTGNPDDREQDDTSAHAHSINSRSQRAKNMHKH